MDKYEILYKRGLISYEEFQERKLQLTLEVRFEDKLYEEFKQLIKNVKKKSKNDIINTSYELVCKNEIKNILLNLNKNKKEFLYLQDEDTLNEFYEDWLKIDGSLADSMRDSIDETITRKMNKSLKER